MKRYTVIMDGQYLIAPGSKTLSIVMMDIEAENDSEAIRHAKTIEARGSKVYCIFPSNENIWRENERNS